MSAWIWGGTRAETACGSIRPIPPCPLPGRDYTGPLAVEDVAREVSALRRRGVRVLCVFTGRDDELPAAQAIYGRDVARIPSITLFADIVGRLIQTCLRDL